MFGNASLINTVHGIAYLDTLANGGVTISRHGDIPKEGYAVATHPLQRSLVVDLEDFRRRGPAILQDYINDQRTIKAASLVSGTYIGTWVNEGKVYIELSIVTHTRDWAIKVAREAGEKAIYDLSAGEEVYINAN